MKNVPNILTVLRIVLAIVFVILFILHFYTCALIVFIVSSLTDFFDGQIARKYNVVSDFGKFADPLADKILVFSALLLLVEIEFIPAWIVIFILFREFTINGLRMVFAAKGKVVPAMFSGKLKTTIQMFVIIFLLYITIIVKGNILEISSSFDLWRNIANYLLLIIVLYSFIDYLFRFDLKKIF
ncbi:CDP-diacylglycerol--glycerol-3-phosphate 3-phosphatidyltransferase [bacterium]|nr:CDP-diacylglycerol--glycerol-3-phosphate 3-phosphatidyltransferase [bacterium]